MVRFDEEYALKKIFQWKVKLLKSIVSLVKDIMTIDTLENGLTY